MKRGLPKKSAAAAMLVVAMAWPSLGQQSIIFSKPADAGAKADASPAPETRPTAHNLFNLPPSVSDVHSPAESIFQVRGAGPTFAVPPAPTISPAQQKAWDKILETKNKWTLMTPEEILGIPTPEKILGLPEKNGDDKLTPEERFMRRQTKSALDLGEKTAANPAAKPDGLLRERELPFGHKQFESAFARPDASELQMQAATARAEGKGGSFFGSLLNSPFVSADGPNKLWGNTFNLPAAAPKPTPEQLAGMDRFRESLDSSTVFEKAATTLRPTVATTLTRDPFMNAASDFNSHGSSFAPLKTDMTRPRGLTPLPGITTRIPEKPKRSPALADLPPWLRDDSQLPPGAPARKF